MRVHDIIEANVEPDQEYLEILEDGVDEALEEYDEYLQTHNDVDDIDVLGDLLNSSVDEDLRMDFAVDHDEPTTNWWMNAEATTGTTEDGDVVTDITVILKAKNMEGVYGPKTFKKMLMRLVSHELVHRGQHRRIPPENLDKMASGYQKAADAKTPREWARKYLRDPHELMAYGETLAQEISDTDNPAATLRNPESQMEMLPTYARFRSIFPRNSKQIKTLLRYASRYLQK